MAGSRIEVSRRVGDPRFVALVLACAVTVASLYVVRLNHPDLHHTVGAWVVLTCSLMVVPLWRVRPAVVLVAALGGATAVLMTSREFFSFWPAGSTLLLVAAFAQVERAHRGIPVVAVVAAGAGWVLAAFGPERQVAAPGLPVLVATLAFLVVRPLWGRLRSAQDLARRAADYRERAELSEAANQDLERRTALARELHDSLGHHVTAMVVSAEAGRVGDPHEALSAIADLGREAMEELEAVLFDLRAMPGSGGPDSADVDLERIETRLALPLRQAGMEVTVSVSTDETDPGRLFAVYRIVQEGLTNVLRHSSASSVWVDVRDELDDLVVQISDDGVGLSPDVSTGNGLGGVRERTALHGGVSELVARRPRGLTLRARLPRGPR